MENKNKDWLKDIMNDNQPNQPIPNQPIDDKAEDNQQPTQENKASEEKGKTIMEPAAQTKTTSESAYEVDIQKALFGIPDIYLGNASNSENGNNNDNNNNDKVVIDFEFGKVNTSSQTTEKNIAAENIEGSENMDESKVVDETFNGDELTKEPKPSHVKNLKFRTGVIALALVIVGATGFVLVKSAPNRKVAKMNASEITTTNNQDNKNSLSKIEGCLRLSKAMKEYQEDNSYITNLDIGTIDVVDGKIIELTDNEYNDIINLLNKIELATKKEKQTDNYKQMIKQFVGYSSKVNAYINYYAPQLINKSILSELDDDGEETLEVNDEEFVVTYDYASNTIMANRTDGGVGKASYSLKTTGKVMKDLTEDLNKGTSSTTTIDSFINDSTKTVLNVESTTITKNSDGSLIVEYSKETNKELDKRVNDAKLQMYRELSQNNGEISYDYFVSKDTINSSQTQESSDELASSNVKTYVKKRTM